MKKIVGVVIAAGLTVLLGCAQPAPEPADEPEPGAEPETIATEDFESGEVENAVTAESEEEHTDESSAEEPTP